MCLAAVSFDKLNNNPKSVDEKFTLFSCAEKEVWQSAVQIWNIFIKIIYRFNFIHRNLCTCSKLMSFEYPPVVDRSEKGAFIGAFPGCPADIKMTEKYPRREIN